MSLAFIPLYIHFMGIEAYGLVGVFVTLQAMTAVLDMGLGSTLNREMARLSIRVGAEQEMRDLLRTLETLFWPVALAIASVLVLLAPLLANDWLRIEPQALPTTVTALMLMGVAIALQWPFGLYAGGLLGLQRQVLLNGITVALATLRGAGAVLVLWLVSPTVIAFFAWQVVISLLQTGFAAMFLWRSLPASRQRSRFRFDRLQSIWRFAAGMSGITILSVILMQLDKIILSRVLSLEMFGYYTLASVVAMSLSRLSTPLFSALYPRFTQLVAEGNEQVLARLYHRSSQLMSVIILPPAIIIALFAREILAIWTQSASTVEHSWLILSLLIIGTALNGLMILPYALQLAYGWTRLTFFFNLVAVVLLVPLIYLMTSAYGAVGAASVWVMLNSSYVMINIQLMHRRLLSGEMLRWYGKDVGIPLLATLATAATGRWLLPVGMTPVGNFFWVAVTALLTLVAAILTAPQIRRTVFKRIGRSTLQLGY